MMDQQDFTIVPSDAGSYTVNAPVGDDVTTFALDLSEADAASGGRLDASEKTARACVVFLLSNQRADDLPARVEINDITAAYPDVVDHIVALWEGKQGSLPAR